MGQQINELISCGPAAPGWKQLDLLLLQSSIHPRKTENPHSSSLVGEGSGRKDTEEEEEEAELGLVLMGTKAGSYFPNPAWGAAAGGAWVGKSWGASGMHQGIINQCMGTPMGFHWRSTGINSMHVIAEIRFTPHSGNAKVLHQITKFYRDASTGPGKTSLQDVPRLTRRPRRAAQEPSPKPSLTQPRSSLLSPQTPQPGLRAPFIPNSQIKGRSQEKAASPHPASALDPKALGMAPQPLD